MAGDYTRMTFRPRKDHAGVLMQQGRVTLDADWNELVELIDRRFRAETVDIVGRCYVSKETPAAFLIGLSGGALSIGPGRAYVHGLLAENHGAGQLEYDPVLGEVRGKGALVYEDQPYLLDAKNVAPLPKVGTYVVYLDVWERELTYLEDQELVEKAIAVDTATRLQTAWQVRLLEAPVGTTCSSDVPGWSQLTAPSGGRLTTAEVGVPASTDPCTIPQSGGYRGTENRLYRVEIHDPGALGTATFKWSRDNASVAAHVKSIDTATSTKLVLDRIGRDGVRRIRVDDWVEVTDDEREFLGQPGELRKVKDVDEVTGTITLTAALPAGAGAFDATKPERHTRVVRWDQAGVAVDALGGKVKVPAGGTASPIVLEDGVQISFEIDAGGGDFHVGDHWVFAARTADASVEKLVEEPPRGIKHHYCRLAVVTFPDLVTDCRMPPEPEDHGCDCTVCVTPQSHANGSMTIQKAIDTVEHVGGKVCLQVGFYLIREPIRIRGARSLHVQGKGWRTVLYGPGQLPAIIVEASMGVTIDSITVVTTTPAKRGVVPMGIAIALRNTIGTVVERCVLAQAGTFGGGLKDTAQPSVARRTATLNVREADLSSALGPRGSGAPLIVLDGIVAETLVHENVFIGSVGIGLISVDAFASLADRRSMDLGLVDQPVSSRTAITLAPRRYLVSYDLDVEDNLFVCSLGGVALEGFSMQLGETRIAHNSVLGCLRAGITSLGALGPLGRIDVLDNLLRVYGTGIAVGTDDTRVCDNDVSAPTPPQAQLAGGLTQDVVPMAGFTNAALVGWAVAAGIVLAPSLRPAWINRSLITGNRVVRVLGDGISIRAPVASASIAHNVLQAIGGHGIAVEAGMIVDLLTVESNQVLDVGAGPVVGGTLAGILLTGTQNAAVVANTVSGVAASGEQVRERMGILVSGCGNVRVIGNDVSDVAAGEFFGLAVGIAVTAPFQQADITDNVVRRGSGQLDAAEDLASIWYGILVPGGEFTVATTNAFAAQKAMFILAPNVGKIVRLPRGRGSLGVHGNVVEAYGRAPAVLVATPGACLFADNRCFLTEGAAREPVVQLYTGALVANANYLEGPDGVAAFVIGLPQLASYTVLGNVASGPITVNGQPPGNQLNVP